MPAFPCSWSQICLSFFPSPLPFIECLLLPDTIIGVLPTLFLYLHFTARERLTDPSSGSGRYWVESEPDTSGDWISSSLEVPLWEKESRAGTFCHHWCSGLMEPICIWKCGAVFLRSLKSLVAVSKKTSYLHSWLKALVTENKLFQSLY